jgi:hypothetical protein
MEYHCCSQTDPDNAKHSDTWEGTKPDGNAIYISYCQRNRGNYRHYFLDKKDMP